MTTNPPNSRFTPNPAGAAQSFISDFHKFKTMAVVLRAETPPAALSDAETREREKCEALICKGWDTFLEVGQALATIRNKRLYRDQHATFEDYCRQKWEFSKSHANRLIEAAVVASILTPIGFKPQSESQLRPLVGLAPQRIPQAWKKAVELADGGQVTARVVRQAAGAFKSDAARPQETVPPKKPVSPKVAAGLLKQIDEAEQAAKRGDSAAVLKALAHVRKQLALT
jgi:hypothetical protein